MPGTVNEPLSFAEIFSLILVLLGFSAAVRDAAQAWRQDRGAVLKTLPLMAVYFVYGAAGIYMTVRLLDGPQPSDRAAALTAFLLAWIAVVVFRKTYRRQNRLANRRESFAIVQPLRRLFVSVWS